jgi:hypothetical protein
MFVALFNFVQTVSLCHEFKSGVKLSVISSS